ncbi:MAG: neutral/alkaline non-lysosomal ceramidase N-terminal domain-containing protein [Armatimonadota bacterium]
MLNLKAAASKVNLNPRPAQWMTGYAGRVEPAEGVHDPLMARAVLLSDDGTLFAIVSCDLLGFSQSFVTSLRQQIQRRLGVSELSLLVACTHTHSGPASMPMRGQMGQVDGEWLRRTRFLITRLVCELVGRLEPAQIAWGSTKVEGVGFNRQDRSRSVDSELVALTIERPDGGNIATIVNYATHAVVLGSRNLLFSADFPGAVARCMDELTGGVGLYLQGACGDVDPVTQIQKGWGQGSFEDCEIIGKQLALAAVNSLHNRARIKDVTIRSARKTVDVLLDPPPSLEEANEYIRQFKREYREAITARHPDKVKQWSALAMLEWSYELRSHIKRGNVPDRLAAEIFAARIGDVRLVGLPFETYTDIGLGIKRNVRVQFGEEVPVMFVGYANGLYGYCPTTWAKEQGGYGADVSCRWFGALVTPVARGTDEILVREATGLVCEL